MDVRFCPVCRDERPPSAMFCAGCGYAFAPLVAAVEARYGGSVGVVDVPPVAVGAAVATAAAETAHPFSALDLPIETVVQRRGLRPFGNRRRVLADAGGKGYAYVSLFRDPDFAQVYEHAFLNRAHENPPPLLIEIETAFMPRLIHTEKFGVMFPYPDDALPDYARWLRETMIACNDTIRPDNYFAGYTYPQVLPNLETVVRWSVIPPPTMPPEYDDLLTDPEGLGFAEVPLAGEGRRVPSMPQPQGPWVGMLLRIDRFSEWSAEPEIKPRNKTEALLEVLGEGRLRECIVRGARYDDGYFAIAIHTANGEDANLIERNVFAARDRCRALQDVLLQTRSLVRHEDLPYNGFVSAAGRYLGN